MLPLDSPFRAKEAEALGVPRWRLRDLARQGALVEIARGVYQRADAPPSAEIDFVAVAKLTPRAVVCLNSALAYWDLSDEIPRAVHIAVPRHSHRPQINYPPVKVHEFEPSAFQLGRERVKVDGGSFWIYGPERTIVDGFRLQRLVGRDQALTALRRYLDRPRRDPAKLLLMAEKLRAHTEIKRGLELLLP